MLAINNLNPVKTIFSKITESSEFEIMFNNFTPENKLSINKFMHLLNFTKYRADNEKLILTQEIRFVSAEEMRTLEEYGAALLSS
jgi:hypothetical protein